MGLLPAGDEELAEAFELIISEYGTNALQHTSSGAPGGVIRAEVHLGARYARLTVLDEGGATNSEDRSSEDLAEDGRGWLLAAAYADEVGHHHTPNGHAAWALIARPRQSAEDVGDDRGSVEPRGDRS